MARTLDQIIAELNPTFQPQIESIKQQQQLIPQQIQSQEQALNAQKDVAFGDILSGARRRGLGFSGIPLSEQAKYLSTNYTPALAGLRQQGQQQAMSLQDALLGIQERQGTLANQIYQTEQDRVAQERQAAAARVQPTLGSFQQPQTIQTPQARVVQQAPGSFAFYDVNNKPITAGQYAQSTNQNIGDVLRSMAENGDKTAQQIYSSLYDKRDNPLAWNNAFNMYSKAYPHLLGGYSIQQPAAPAKPQSIKPQPTSQKPKLYGSQFNTNAFALGGR